ncbi:TIGR04141 family sporadically distributed protein [Saccharothrix obliqua]|uniref:TIGR04141 family sporadically distributed protein n=1 Tax=Saccharothrix obliqua TaxID=2861747 RepID=UPI001C5CDB1A|nr:TIGR04141 family sporadically distributed protein [Saccharothrix obliqua]MBW4717954.1 TIGR04141 family sporadically distributed protein [Saccharothrix obliqua]
MTLHRYRGGRPLPEYVPFIAGLIIQREGYVAIDGVRAYTIAGVRPAGAPAWHKDYTHVIDENVDLVGTTPFAVIVLPVGRWVVVATYGGGHHLLDDSGLDEGFGLLYAIRRLDPAELRTVTSSRLDLSARVSRTSFPSGSPVAGFGVDPVGELVTGLTGKASLEGMTYHEATGGRQYQIRAGDSLAIKVGNAPETFVADIKAICRIVDESDDGSPLRLISQVRPLRTSSPLIAGLEDRLAVALGGDDRFGSLGLCLPTTAVAAVDEANSYYSDGVGGSGPFALDADLDATVLVERFAAISESTRVSELRKSRLTPCADEHGEESLTRPIPMEKWIAFETVIDGNTYCLHQGRWYEIGEDAADRVREQVADLLVNRSSLDFPLWTPTGKSDDEHRYCERVARQPGYLCLDKSFAHTPMHPRFELADVIGPGNEIVHVKWLARAAAASHLFTQVRVSAWAQRVEAAAMAQLDAKVHLLDDSRRVTERPRVVVLAIAGRKWDVKTLFTLSMVELLRLRVDLSVDGISLQFADIPFVAKQGGSARRRAA